MTDWELAFLATSVALGESVESARRALGDDAFGRVEEAAHALRATNRGARAGALALALAPIAHALDAITL